MNILSRKFDVAIIGGGPAGMSASLWCADMGLTAILIEREGRLGGQLASINNPIKNYLGLETSNGDEMTQRLVRSLDGLNCKRLTGVAVEKLDLDAKVVTMADGNSFDAGAIVIATGVRRRTLGIPGEREFQGRGILCSGVGEKLEATGKAVVIIGGGDAAIENALILSDVASRVTVIHRRSDLSARREFSDEAKLRSNIELVMEAVVTSINGGEKLTSVTVKTGSTESVICTDLVLVRIGVVPNSELVAGILERDENNFIKVDASGRTSMSGIFAVGDVANPGSPTISTAVGTAATAIKSIKFISN